MIEGGVKLLGKSSFVMDACVIIDYCDSHNQDILEQFVSVCRRVIVSVLTPGGKAKSLSVEDCSRIGIKIMDLRRNNQIMDAIQLTDTSGLSFDDSVNLILARDTSSTLVTNDKTPCLRASRDQIPFIRGLRIMSLLVQTGRLGVDEALRTAKQIGKINPNFMNCEISTLIAGLTKGLLLSVVHQRYSAA